MTIVHLFVAIIMTCALVAGIVHGFGAAMLVLIAALFGVWAVCAGFLE